jgi:mRNA-degrading endonuclease RelE of RelBE toxin-antitoxin system
MSYKVRVHRLFIKDLRKVPNHHQKSIHEIITKLRKNPSVRYPNLRKIKGEKDIFRIKFGRHRLIVFLSHKTESIYIIGIGPRGKVYKIMKRLLS